MRHRHAAIMFALQAACLHAAGLPAVADAQRAPAAPPRWVATWTTGLIGALPYPFAGSGMDSGLVLTGRTLRQVVRVSVGGSRVRLRFSNEYGARPLRIAAVHVAHARTGAAIDVATDRAVTFDGRPSVVIRAGASLVSDPVPFDLPPGSDLAISAYFADPTRGTTVHFAAHQRSYRSAAGNMVSAAVFAPDSVTERWHFLAGVDVVNPRVAGVIVAMGNSITDGTGVTIDANLRWPDVLARRMLASREPLKAVVNVGIGGNQVVSPLRGPSALQRFDRDVLMQPGVTHVIVLEGINDIYRGTGAADPGTEVPLEELIAGHKQLIERARERGVVIIGATLTAIGGNSGATPERTAKRAAFNHWMRTSGAYDAVIDFDRVTRDPSDTTRLRPAYDSGDHLHPGDAGYRAMGEAIDLALFRARRR